VTNRIFSGDPGPNDFDEKRFIVIGKERFDRRGNRGFRGGRREMSLLSDLCEDLRVLCG